MRKKAIQLPKVYLSYSQITLWKSDPSRYKEIYINRRDEFRLSNAAMDYGKTVADAIENDTRTGDLMTDSAILLFPKYDVRDKEIRTEFKTANGVLYLVGRPDTLDSDTKNFREYKTGTYKWTQRLAERHFQLKFYAALIYLAYDVMVDHAWLDWAETEKKEDGTITMTGKVQSFKVPITFMDILETLTEATKVAKEIETEFINSKKYHVDDIQAGEKRLDDAGVRGK